MKWLAILFCTTFLWSCANRSSPTGGPKDEEPPKLIESQPFQGERNYTTSEIVLTFDEDISLKNAKTQILVTPRTDVNYDIKYKRNIVTLEFDSLLDSNTTYTISFRESIVDITENNPAVNLQLAFSTGPDLDTLQLSGLLTHALTREKPKAATVVLYRDTDTTDIFTGLPYYFTETNDSGRYTLNNIKAGRYRIYALNDYNSDLKVQSDTEPYGFINDTLSIGANNPDVNISITNLNIDSLKVFNARRLGSTFNIKYNKGITEFSYNSEDSLLVYQDHEDASVIRVQSFETIPLEDSVAFTLNVRDSIGFTRSDQFYGKFDKTSTRKQDFFQSIDAPPVLVKKPVLDFNMKFSKSAKILNIDSLYIQIDSLTRYSFDTSKLTWNNNHTLLSLTYELDPTLFEKPDTVVRSKGTSSARPFFKWAKQSFVSYEGDTLKSGKEDLSFLLADGTSTLIIIASNAPDYSAIIQIVDTNDKVLHQRSINQNGTFTFKDIVPGSYVIRIIHDVNGNGKWDPGNYFERVQPERIQYLREESGSKNWNLRANFEFEQSINLGGE